MRHRVDRGTQRRGGRRAAAARSAVGRAHTRTASAVMLAAAMLALADGGPLAPAPAPTAPAASLAVPATAPSPVAAAALPTAGGCTGVDATAEADEDADGTVGGLLLDLAHLMCSPLGPAAGLPATELEAQEPERLYALVDADHPVRPAGYAPDDLVPLQDGPYEAREEVADHLEQLLAAAARAGHTDLVVQSGFRSYEDQAGSHEDWVNRVGAERAEVVSAAAGHSEHQLGLAVDLTGPCGFSCTGETPDERWLAGNAHRFGFVVRYPEGGEAVTGYVYEPWHLRYVGPRAAWGMHLHGEPYWERFADVALDAAGTRPG